MVFQFAGNSEAEATTTFTTTHCVFRRGLTWLALPAMSVREALPQPEMVFVPVTPKTFEGLCHVRSEFITVLNLDHIMATQSHSRDQIMLILDDCDGPWGLLVDEVSSLVPLEVSDAPDGNTSESQSAVIGWATLRDKVIQVLDQGRIRETATKELAAIWERAEEVGSDDELAEVGVAACGGKL